MQLGNKYQEVLVSNWMDGDYTKQNSASLDLEIGNKVKLVSFGGYKFRNLIEQPGVDPYSMMFVPNSAFEPIVREVELDLDEFPDGIWVRPGVGVLLETKAEIHIPDNVTAQAVLKSSRGREFYQLMGAGFYDNGFKGQGNIQLCGSVIPIYLETGLRIVQLVFNGLTDYSYTYAEQPDAKYQNQTGVQGSKDAKF